MEDSNIKPGQGSGESDGTGRNASRRSYSVPDRNLLWGASAGRCNCPTCRAECYERETDADGATTRMARFAHIIASSDKGPRGDSEFSIEDRDKYKNLILLCSTCHDLVDGQPNTYTTDILRQWKTEHEEWVRDSLEATMSQVTFKELEEVCSAIATVPSASESDLTLTDPARKMAKNGLTDSVRFLLDIGVARSALVQEYIQSKVDTDYEFPEVLKAGFLSEYYSLFATGLRGDDLFQGLREFASGNRSSFERQAAGLAVLCYLFQTCEVFER